MAGMIKQKLQAFMESDKDVPLLVGFISGFYPFLFFYSNNYPSVNSWSHLIVFSLIYVGIPIIITLLSYYFFGKIEKLKPYRKHLLFVLLIFLTSLFMSQAIYMTLKKKVLLGVLVLVCAASIKMYNHYKKLIIIIAIMALMPLSKCLVSIYEGTRTAWAKPDDAIMDVKFKHKPNIYMIQPDGYVSREVIEQAPITIRRAFTTG
jgi:hypothetical protein